jgi:hypothetical protein
MNYHCIAPSHMKCFNVGLDQCDYCKWKEEQAAILKKHEQSPQSIGLGKFSIEPEK